MNWTRAVWCVVVIGCGRAEGDPAARPEVTVRLGMVRRDSVAVVVQADGRLVSPPDGSALLAAPVDAVVRDVAVQLGGRVRAGAILVRLDAPEVAAQAAALGAQAATAAQTAERERQLLAEGISARRQAEEAATAAEALQAQGAAADSLVTRLTVRSPLPGVVSRLAVRRGERVAAGQLLAEVVNPGVVFCSASVPASDLGRIRVGQVAQIQVEGGDSSWMARVASIGPVVDSISNMGTVLLRLTTLVPAMRPGLAARVRIVVELRRAVLVVPASALVYAGNATVVFVVGADSIARARPVGAGVRAGDVVEVDGDLHEGDRIVVGGAYGLPDSTKVLSQPDSAS